MALLKNLKLVIGLSKKGLTKLNADLRRTKSNFRRNFGEISNLAKQAGAAIMTGVAAGLTAIVKSGADLQTLKVGFRSIMGSAEGAATMVEKLNKFTASTPFRLQEVATSARQLIAVGVGVEDLNDRMGMLGDIAAASGNSIQDIAAAFSKVQAKGKVELENLNQLAERGIPIFAELKKVTGDANMEFGAGKVSVEQYNQALANMATEGGFANGAMENLSETVSGKFSTAMDNVTLALGEFAEKSGLLATITNALDDMTKQVQRMSIGDGDLVKSREEVYDISVRLREAHKGNITALQEEAKAAYDTAFAVNQALDTASSQAHLKGARKMYDRVTEAMAFANTSLSTLPDAPADGDSGKPEQTKEEFTAQFNAAAALTAERQRLAEATRTNVVTTQDLAEAQQGLRDIYGGMSGEIAQVALEEEELFDEDSVQRIADMERQLQRVAFAAANIGGAFSITSQLTEAAFNNIKDKSQGFHEVVKNMLESLLKKAIALAAAFAAMSIFTGGGAAAATKLGGFKEFMMGGLGIQGFAAGGMVTGPTMAMVGEGPGTTLSNPEVIAPLDKLQQMMGGGAVTVTGMIRGSDILLSNERSALDRNRVRGF